MDKYEEALEKARAEYEKARKQGYTWLMGLLEGMFPELKEIEDERIRQAIIAVVEWAECFNSSSVTHEDAETMLAYLEKQKELPTNEEMLRTLRAEYEKGVADTIAKYEQKEQKFTEKQDYSDLTDLERAIHRGFLVVGVENVPVTIIKETAQDCLAWMKPAEWSEEDEKMRGTCIDLLEHFPRPCGEVIGPWKDCIAWLKSLRPQPHWKPSKEQMYILNWVANILLNHDGIVEEEVAKKLQSLYNDLKEL